MTANDARGGRPARPGYWFRPRSFGLGAVPATPAGWIATLAFVGLMLAVLRWVRPERARIGLTVGLLLSFVMLAWAKTDGSWRWRWGSEEE